MKLCKPSYAFGANQRSFSKYEHQEHMSESNYAYENKSASAYDSHAEEYVLGQSMVGFDANESSHAMGNKSTNYYANAQSALPSPTIHVQQGHHAMGKMKKHEGYIGQDWGSNSPKYAAPAYVDHSRDAMHDGSSHMMGGTAQPYYVGQSDYKDREQKAYNYNNEGGIQGGYANKSPILSSPNYLSPIKTNQPGLTNHKDGYMVGKMDNGWGNSANYSSPTHGPRSGQAIMHQDEMGGDIDHGWANSASNFSSPTHAQRSGLAINKEKMMGNRDHGWLNSPTKFSSSTPPRHSAQGMYKKDHLVEQDDRGWAHSPSKFSSPPQPHYSSRAIPKDGQMMGSVNNGWANSPTKYSAANNFNNSNNNMHSEDEQLGWTSKSIHGFGQNQVNHSAHTPYAQHDQCVDDDVHDIMDEILTKYPAHNVSGGGRGSGWGAKPNAYGGQNQVGGYAKQQAYGASTHYGGAAQSMSSSSSKFASNKEEYSASSRAKKFEASSMLNSGGYY